ncbi:MAG: hypothetical protein COX66_14925 [Elusimicrobia bacterium CG_4_10_14_0_2_um_filter_63_34]|nr:MAG: hypothetical protein COX66_14925 [Elusimicrobia bacterium CG_4_10_14_0_2_um_filter_63_34]
MADQRVVDYLKQNSGSYPIETLKQALRGQGFPDTEISAAMVEAGLGAPPPPPGPGNESAAGGFVDLTPGNLFANAKWMLTDPIGYFDSLDPETRIGPALGTTLLWSLIAGDVFALIGLATQTGIQKIAAVAQILLFPMMSLVFSFVGAGIFHLICKLLGGTAPYRGSYAVLASVSALFPVSALLSLVPYAGILLQLYGLFLSVQGASGVHKVDKRKAWVAFGLLAALGVMGSIYTQRQARELQKMLQQMEPPGTAQGAQSGLPAGAPPEIQRAMAQALAGIDDPEMKAKAQQAMMDAARDPNAILRDMARYQQMSAPPKDTLALLDEEGQSALEEAWPAMAAPIRKSLVEQLPATPAAQRPRLIKDMRSASADMNKMLGNGMEMLQKMQQQAADAQ